MILKADHYIEIDRSKTLRAQAHKGHNRWHPDIPPIARVDPGQVVGIETFDAFDLQVNESTTPAQVAKCNLNVIHPLTGPIYINGAEDLTLAARNALLNMIDLLVGERCFTRQQAYAICSVAVDLRVA
jgi:acetamidase/formamidase